MSGEEASPSMLHSQNYWTELAQATHEHQDGSRVRQIRGTGGFHPGTSSRSTLIKGLDVIGRVEHGPSLRARARRIALLGNCWHYRK